MTKELLKVSIVQVSLEGTDIPANLAQIEENISEANLDTDLIILPETFNTGFTNDLSTAEHPKGYTSKWMHQIASRYNAVVLGSFLVKEKNNKYHNRILWMNPDGTHDFYDKRHLFKLGGEKALTEGKKKLIKEIKGWKICPLVCYDLRFPVWSRNVWKNDSLAYDILVYCTSWPSERYNIWKALLPARAIENQAYVIGANRSGKDDSVKISYPGKSQVFDFNGNSLLKLSEEASIETFHFEPEALEEYRKNFPAYLDADEFSVEL